MSSTRGQHLLGKEIGDCLLEKGIGYGGSSAVFLAQPRNTDQKVAIKVFLPRSTMDAPTQKSFYRRFLREAQAASELHHAHILSIYSYGEHQGLPYIMMPYMPGGTLAEYVKEHGPLTLREAQAYIEQIAEALDYAHKQGCIHCDVKPANILLDSDGQVMLSDFGIVRILDGAAFGTSTVSHASDTLMGTPDYISPEQALGDKLDGRTDVYSLAVSLYFLLTGSPPFNAESPIAMALMHVHDKPPLLSQSRGDVTPRIDTVLNKALEKWPEERYQSPGAFSQAFGVAITEASQTRDIDSVALTTQAQQALIASRQKQSVEGEEALQPLVKIRRNTYSLPFSRLTLMLFVLGIVLLGSVVTTFALVSSLSTHQHQPPHVTPTPTQASSDMLIAHEELWPKSNTYYFLNGHYYIHNTSQMTIAMALYPEQKFSNCLLTVTSKEVAPSQDATDFYGIVLRASQDQSHYYLFEVSSSSSGGQFEFFRYDQSSKPSYSQLPGGNGSVPSLRGIGQSNTISIAALGNTFTISVNGKQISKITDPSPPSTFASGEVGLIVEDYNAEVAFSNLQISAL